MEHSQKNIDLQPNEWRSSVTASRRHGVRHPREPFFGPGLPGALAYFAGWLFTFWLIHIVIFPTPAPKPSGHTMEVGETATLPGGWTVTRTK